MEVTALCVRLLIHVLMLLVAEDRHCYCAEKVHAAFLRVVPNRLQLFEYDSIFFDCEGFDDFTGWKVMRSIMGVNIICGPDWKTSRGPCAIQHAFEGDSGEYWCEANGTERSNSVNISVTAGSVILESPAVPVMEGDAVTLRCRNRTTSSVQVADFYKDGSITQTGYKGNMTIHNVSKSDEGLYKCNIIGVGESAESWLAVGASRHEETHHSPGRIILLITVAMGTLSLLVVGLLCGKPGVLVWISSKTPMPGSHPGEAETEVGVSSCTATLAIDTPSAVTNQSTSDEYVYYCTID